MRIQRLHWPPTAPIFGLWRRSAIDAVYCFGKLDELGAAANETANADAHSCVIQYRCPCKAHNEATTKTCGFSRQWKAFDGGFPAFGTQFGPHRSPTATIVAGDSSPADILNVATQPARQLCARACALEPQGRPPEEISSRGRRRSTSYGSGSCEKLQP